MDAVSSCHRIILQWGKPRCTLGHPPNRWLPQIDAGTSIESRLAASYIMSVHVIGSCPGELVLSLHQQHIIIRRDARLCQVETGRIVVRDGFRSYHKISFDTFPIKNNPFAGEENANLHLRSAYFIQLPPSTSPPRLDWLDRK